MGRSDQVVNLFSSKLPVISIDPPNSPNKASPITTPANGTKTIQGSAQSPHPFNDNKSLANLGVAGPSTTESSDGLSYGNSSQKGMCDVLEKAIAAIASAERASAAACAAAMLVNAN